VRQEDLFFSQLTVRETLSLAIELQLHNISSSEERDEYVNNLLFKTGLVSFSISYNLFQSQSSYWFLSRFFQQTFISSLKIDEFRSFNHD
jgi:hypothetical protein